MHDLFGDQARQLNKRNPDEWRQEPRKYRDQLEYDVASGQKPRDHKTQLQPGQMGPNVFFKTKKKDRLQMERERGQFSRR